MSGIDLIYKVFRIVACIFVIGYYWAAWPAKTSVPPIQPTVSSVERVEPANQVRPVAALTSQTSTSLDKLVVEAIVRLVMRLLTELRQTLTKTLDWSHRGISAIVYWLRWPWLSLKDVPEITNPEPFCGGYAASWEDSSPAKRLAAEIEFDGNTIELIMLMVICELLALSLWNVMLELISGSF